MSELEYFVEIPEGYTEDRPDGLWRRTGKNWEFFSLVDWTWHPGGEAYPPETDEDLADFHPVSVERAEELAADRQRWVRYWAAYFDEPAPGEEPFAVLRRRRSPEDVLDEAFVGEGDTWQRTPLVVEGEVRRSADAPHLMELTAEDAERLIQKAEGVQGATSL